MAYSLTSKTIGALVAEVGFARNKFPDPSALSAALFEEFAEWCGEGDETKAKRELLQVACVALRIYEEGDPLERHTFIQQLKERGMLLEPIARDVIRELLGPDAAARSIESDHATEVRSDQ